MALFSRLLIATLTPNYTSHSLSIHTLEIPISDVDYFNPDTISLYYVSSAEIVLFMTGEGYSFEVVSYRRGLHLLNRLR